MSFFFSKAKPRKASQGAAGAAKNNRPPASARQNNTALTRLGCAACPLNKASHITTPKMPATLSPNQGEIYFMAAAPGLDEDQNTGKPITGPMGSLLRSCIPDGEAKFCSFDNVINCRPEGKRLPLWNEVECCRSRRIKFIGEAKPMLIVGLGPIVLQWMLGTADLQGTRGRLFAVKVGDHACWFMPTYAPDEIVRLAYDEKKPLRSRLGHCFKTDIKRAFEALPDLKPPTIFTAADTRSNIQIFDGHGVDQFEKLLKLIAEAAKAPIKAVDLETQGLRPYRKTAAIMTAAVSYGEVNFSFAVDHPKAGWTKEQRKVILGEFFNLLTDDTPKIAHNTPFELEWFIWLYGESSVVHHVWHDTMMQAHFIDERKGARETDGPSRYQALDFLIKQHFGLSYKSLFKLDKKNMAKADLTETLIYNGCDTKLTLPLYHLQNKILKQKNVYQAYLDCKPRQPTVALIQSLGVPVDQPELKRSQAKLEGEIKTLTAEINDLKVVKAFVKDHKVFNPFSGPDAITIFKEYLRQNVSKTGSDGITKESVDKGILDKIDHPLAKMIVTLRNRSKMKSTYVDELEFGKGEAIYDDNKLHTNFGTTTTETGRLSSSGLNMQNFPMRKDRWVRRSIVPPPDHLMVAIDFGGLEACTGAMCSKDKYLVKALWEDYDIHAEWSQRAAKKIPGLIGGQEYLTDKKVMKDFRSLIKNKLVFPAFFGATAESVCGYLSGATGFEAPLEKVNELMEEFWGCFQGMYEWQQDTMKVYYDEGYVADLVGRKHNYPLTRNQAINMPIQGSGAVIVCDAMNRLSIKATETGQWHIHPVLNVHDDLTFFIPDDDSILEKSLETISREMLTYEYPWINVPLSIEISMGKNWADLEPLDKLWSHKKYGYPRKEF